MTSSLAYLTGDIPGSGGVIKQRPEDFVVQELPLYEPCGRGEHLYLFIEKRGRTTTSTIRRLAKVFGVRRSDVGYAGLKDKHAIARQHFSIYLPDRTGEAKGLSRIEYTPLKLLWANRHTNKLRRGHLVGNRFVIYVREVDPAAAIHVKTVLDRLARTGVPNFVGEQRFGYRQNNHLLGQYLLQGAWQTFLDHLLGDPRDEDQPMTRAGREAYMRGDFAGALQTWPRQLRHDRQALDALRQGRPARDAVLIIDRQQLEFCISGTQSAIFNQVLDRRLRGGWFDHLIEGDLAWKHDNGSIFSVDQATADHDNRPEGRVRRLELSPSGPMWGLEMCKPKGAPLRSEAQALSDHGLTEADLAGHDHARAKGTRRPLRVKLIDPQVSFGSDEQGPHARVSFTLPRGSYATIVLREIMKNDCGHSEVSAENRIER